MSAHRPDWTDLDQQEREKFRLIRRLVCKCRERWPNAKIVLRSSDSVCINLETQP